MLETLVRAGAFDGLDPSPNRRKVFYALQTVSNARKPHTRVLLSPETQAPDLPDLSADETLWLDLEAKGISESGRHPPDAHRARLRDVDCKPPAALRHGSMDRGARVQPVISPDLREAHRVLSCCRRPGR